MDLQILEEGNNCTIYCYDDETGDARIQVYHLFPGLDVSYISIHTSKIDFSKLNSGRENKYIGFHYCKEGRIEQEVEGEFFYLMPGDCLAALYDPGIRELYFPLKHYHGISIEIDPSRLESRISEYLGNKRVEPEEVIKHLCKAKTSVILRDQKILTHIFTESYYVKEENRIDYLKIKVMELLFAMSHLDLEQVNEEEIYVSRGQAGLVKNVAVYISDHINEKISLQELTTRFGISESYLQKIFRSVYGMTVASFIRAEKMQNAAQILIHTERSIDDIAAEFGYVNESKFSAAFKKIMGDTPSIFRKEHTKIKIK